MSSIMDIAFGCLFLFMLMTATVIYSLVKNSIHLRTAKKRKEYPINFCKCCGCSSSRLNLLADWFDFKDRGKMLSHVVQSDLRQWANNIDANSLNESGIKGVKDE